MPENPFQQAVKRQLKARVALDGPTGAGKTWTALSMAEVLAEDGKVAVADTERGKALLYAHRFTFDHMSFEPPYDVNRLCDVLRAAEDNGYACTVIDSMTHFWTGEGGVLDAVDAAAAKAQGNKFVGWNHGTPLQRKMVDTILGLDMHVIVTMRSKMEYVQEKDDRGKTTIRKVGMQPVQRDGLEYEFDVIGDLDLDHRMLITKSRADVLADQLIQPHSEKDAAKLLLAFLNDGERLASPADMSAIRDLVGAIGDKDERNTTRRMFRDLFGAVDQLRESQVAEAREWVVSRMQEIDGPGGATPQQSPGPVEVEAGEQGGEALDGTDPSAVGMSGGERTPDVAGTAASPAFDLDGDGVT